MRLSVELFAANRAVAEACLGHRFVRGLADGSLDPERFRAYVAQDAFYLRAFARAYALAAARSRDPETLHAFVGLIEGVDEELGLHSRLSESLGIDLGVVRPMDSTSAYTDFLLATAWMTSLPETIAAMAPCMRLYAWLGTELARDGVPDHAYADWIRTYSSEDFGGLADLLDGLLDRHADDTPEVRRAYSRAMELELAFFDSFAGS